MVLSESVPNGLWLQVTILRGRGGGQKCCGMSMGGRGYRNPQKCMLPFMYSPLFWLHLIYCDSLLATIFEMHLFGISGFERHLGFALWHTWLKLLHYPNDSRILTCVRAYWIAIISLWLESLSEMSIIKWVIKKVSPNLAKHWGCQKMNHFFAKIPNPTQLTWVCNL